MSEHINEALIQYTAAAEQSNNVFGNMNVCVNTGNVSRNLQGHVQQLQQHHHNQQLLQHQNVLGPKTAFEECRSFPEKHTVHWFRKGLRLHDNPSLRDGIRGSKTYRCIFVLDPWFAGSSNVGINKWRWGVWGYHIIEPVCIYIWGSLINFQ